MQNELLEVIMINRKLACGVIAAFSVALATHPTHAFAKDQGQVFVVTKKADPELERRVSFVDLNLAYREDQKALKSRIFRTAGGVCFDINGPYQFEDCRSDAVNSTKGQIDAAIKRAKRQMAGLPVGPAVAISIVIGAR